MATDLNIVALVGRLTRPCDMRYSANGNAVCSFSIAVNRRQKGSDGNWSDKPSFFECTYFGKAAEGVSKYLVQGQQVSINGHLDQNTWVDRNTNANRSKIVVIVDSLSLIGNSGNTNSNNNVRQTYDNNRNQNQNYGSNNNNYSNQQFGNTGNQQFDNSNMNYNNNQNNSYGNSNNMPIDNGPEDFADDIPF